MEGISYSKDLPESAIQKGSDGCARETSRNMTPADHSELSVKPNVTILEAVKLMNANSMQILLVVDDNQVLLGVVTDGDIRRALLDNVSFSEPICAIMNSNPITMTYPPNKKKALNLMKENDIKHIPVLDSEGKTSGLILWKDLFANGDITFECKPNIVVIMAGGKGTRLDLFTKILPKPLIPIGEKPIIEHIMSNFSNYGFQKFVISLNYKAEMIKTYFSENHENYDINYVQEEKFLGTAGSLSLCHDILTDTFLVSNCDILTDANLDALFTHHKTNKNYATVLGAVRNVRIPYGVLKSTKGDLEDIIEKPEYHFVINSGIYVLEPDILELIPENRPIHMTDLLVGAKAEGLKTQVYPMTCSWFDVGEWAEYKKALDHMNSLGIVN